jgi:hypothetical protein
MEEMERTSRTLLPSKWRWVLIAVAILAAASACYGVTQLQYNREREKNQILQEQYRLQLQQSSVLQQQIERQDTQMDIMQSRFDALQQSSVRRDTSKTGITITTKYDPTTGKLLERMEYRLDEIDKSISESKTETHSATAANSTAVVSISATTTLIASSTVDIAASSTVSITEKDKVVIKPADAGQKREMRFTIGAAYFDGGIEPVAGYTVRAFGVGKIVSIGPGIVVGRDFIGGQATADVLDLPRIGIGYGCTWKFKNCGQEFSLGIKLAF